MTIEWSTRAKEDYEANIRWLLEERTEQEAINFIDAVESTLWQLRRFPNLFQQTGYKGLYGGPVIPVINVFYRIDWKENVIELVRFWHNEQSPTRFSS